MLNFDKNKFCVGCTSCYSVCSQNAIKMEENVNGFYVPVIQVEHCVSCGRCDNVCPVIAKEKEPRDIRGLECVYTYQLNTISRMRSTSGAVFYTLAIDIIRQGGLVCGCVWDDNYKAKHICTDNIEAVNRMRRSKYVQSDLGDCFLKIKEAIKIRPVLFSGTPCQTTALRNYLGNTDKLITCAVICGGVPSPKVWRIYKNALENNVNSKIVDLQMRSKETNWLVPELKVAFKNGRKISEILLTENLYGTNFGMGLTVSNACMHCSFKLDTIQADVVIGDHWGINARMLKKSRNKGASVVIFLTQRGKIAFNNIEDEMYSELGNIIDTVNSHSVLMSDHCENENRGEFFASIDKENILSLLGHNLPESIRNSLSKRKLLRKLKLYIPLYTLRWRMKQKK